MYAYVDGDPISLTDPFGLEGVGPWNNGTMNNVTGYVPANACEQEAVADLLVDLVPFTALVAFGLDVVGVDVNFYVNPGLDGGQYSEVKTPYAVAGHSLNTAAYLYEQKAARQLRRASARGIHYSVANGRANLAAKSLGRASRIGAVASFLGPLGAFMNYKSNFEKCQCNSN